MDRRQKTSALGAFCSTNSFDQCLFHFHFYCFRFLLVTCFYSEGQVRMVDTSDGLEETEGSVEVYFTGGWTVVCDDEWYIKEVSVVCRQLMQSRHTHCAKLTSRRKNHLALKVLCNGSETTVGECSVMRMPSQSCTLAKAVCKKKECELEDVVIFEFATITFCSRLSPRMVALRRLLLQRFSVHSTMRKTSLEEGRCGMFSINRPCEQAFALRLLSKFMEDDVWISVRREDSDAFKWINGEPLRC